MKRILAAVLTLAMVLNIAPVGALAASDSDAASIQAVAEPEETSLSELDEETARAIASDPFLRQSASAPVEQEQQAEVDTSNVSMTATNSFGQLLVNGMEAQNGTSENYAARVTRLTMNGRTANVEFVLDGTADLVVAVYTDSDAEEMVASGTVEVTGNGNTTAQVAITGDIPETYTVKAFLLDMTEHTALSAVYTDTSHTQVMVDLDNATVNDFPEDRVINLDDQSNTNFAVVNEDTTLLTYEDNTAGENQLLSEDDTSLVYTFGNPSAEIRNLQPGDILTYEYAPGELLIARVQDITVNGDTVTIQGDDTLEPTDVFDILKIEEFADSGELVHSDEGMDPAVTYLGTSTGVDAENKFEIKDGAISDNVPIVDNITHEFALNGTLKDIKDGMLSVTVNGEVSLFANIDFAYYIAWNKQWIALSSQVSISGKISVGGAISAKVPLGPLHTPKMLKKIGIEAEITPNIVLELSGQITFKFSYEQRMLLGYSTMGRFQNLSEPAKGKVEPVMDDDKNTSKTISIFAGLEIGPKVQLGDELLWVEFKLKGGVKASAEPLGTGEGVRHECAQCLDFTEKLTGKLTIKLILLKKDLVNVGVPEEINLLDIPIGNWYWSLTFGEIGEGTCPHLTYHVQISVKNHRESGITIYEKLTSGTQMKFVELGKTDENGTLQVYLPMGNHDLTASIGKQNYSGMAMITGSPTEIELSPERTEQPDESEKSDYTIENGRLTIYNENMMMDYARAEDTPWYSSRDEITYILTQYGVKKISSYAFAECDKVTEVRIGDEITEIDSNAFSGCSALEKVSFVGTMAQWKALSIGEGNDILKKVKVVCSDGTIEGSGTDTDETIVASGTCGENLTWRLNDEGTLTISGSGEMENYFINSSPWHVEWEKIKNVVIQPGATSVGNAAFSGCRRLISVAISKDVINIGNYAFSGCDSLTNVAIPKGVKNIGAGAFSDCSKLTDITIPEGVTSIGNSMFYGCSSLTNIEMPDGVTVIGDWAFYECNSLTNIELPKSVINIGEGTFADCSKLEKIVIPEGVEGISSTMFSCCSNLKNIELPNSIKYIGNDAFSSSGLTRIDFPDGVTSIGTTAFYFCHQLTDVTMTDSVQRIGPWAFCGCENLMDIKLSKSLKRIEEKTFLSCKKLTSITIPANVTVIDTYAFYDCGGLTSVSYLGTMAQWETVYVVDFNLLKKTIHCTDGDIVPATENSITVGSTASASAGNKVAATFSNAKAGKEYVVIVSRSENEALSADNLLYINQITATADGELAVPFITTADTSEMRYIVACTRDDQEPENPDKPTDPSNPDKPTDPDQPTNPDDPGEVSPDGGSGMAIILIGGVAVVAAVAGVVLMMPVDVQGTVKLADQPVANATVQVMQGDNVTAQTTTNADGWFAVKVRRGNYTLRVLWTDAEGKPVTRTMDFKAPNSSLSIAA